MDIFIIYLYLSIYIYIYVYVYVYVYIYLSIYLARGGGGLRRSTETFATISNRRARVPPPHRTGAGPLAAEGVLHEAHLKYIINLK